MKKRILALLFVLTLLLSLFAGCAGQSETPAEESQAPESAPAQEPEAPAEEPAPEGEPSEEPEAPAEPEVPEEPQPATGSPADAETFPIQLPIGDGTESFDVWLGMSPAALGYIDDYSEQNLAYKTICERTGVKINFDLYHPDQTQTLWSLMLAGGDFSDVLAGRLTYVGGVDQGVTDDVFLELSELAPQYAPNYYAKITSNDELYDSILTAEGNLIYLAALNSEYRGPDQGLAIRGDYLDALGLEVPTTVDGIHDTLAAIQEEFGTQSPMWLPVSCFYTEGNILSAFGGSSDMYNDGGTIRYGIIEEPVKEYLQVLNQWYSEGLIWRDFPTYGAQEMFRNRDMIASGETVFFRTETTEFSSFANLTENPDAYFVAVPEPVLNEGDILHVGRNNPGYLKSLDSWVISTSCENPEVVLQVADYMYTDEGSLLSSYGIEGETFYYDEDGVPHLNDVILNNEVYDYRVAILMYVLDVGPYVMDSRRGTESYTPQMIEASSVWISTPTDEAFKIPQRATMNAEEQAEADIIASDIDTYISENVIRFVTGTKPFDEWDEFVTTIQGMNLDRLVELNQIAYDRYMAEN